MAWFRRRQRQSTARRVISALVVVAYLVVCGGLPLPALAKDRGDPFPCRNNPCSCRSAADCCQSCSCNRPVEPPPCCAGKPQSQPPSARILWVSGISALGCHGVDLLVAATGGVAAPPPALLSWSDPLDPVGWLDLDLVRPTLTPSEPSSPPPRPAFV